MTDLEELESDFIVPITRRTGGRPLIAECKRGHKYDDENTIWLGGKRRCKACRRIHSGYKGIYNKGKK